MAAATNKYDWQPFPCDNGYLADGKGPRGLRLVATLTAGERNDYDMAALVNDDVISGIQTVRLNNAAGTSPLTYTDANRNVIHVGPGKITQVQCSFPADAIGSRFSLYSRDGGAVSVTFWNVPMPAFEIGEQSADAARLVINNAAAAGVTPLVPALAGQNVRTHRLRLSVAAATIVEIRSGVTVLETFNFAGAGLMVLDWSDRPYHVTASGAALNLNSSAAVQVNGVLEYVQR